MSTLMALQLMALQAGNTQHIPVCNSSKANTQPHKNTTAKEVSFVKLFLVWYFGVLVPKVFWRGKFP